MSVMESPIYVYTSLAFVFIPLFIDIILMIPLSYIFSKRLDPVVREKFPDWEFVDLDTFPTSGIKTIYYTAGVVCPGWTRYHFKRYPLRDHVGKLTRFFCLILFISILAGGIGLAMGFFALGQNWYLERWG